MVEIARWKASPGPRRDFVGYGRTPPDIRWPGGAAVAVDLEGACFMRRLDIAEHWLATYPDLPPAG